MNKRKVLLNDLVDSSFNIIVLGNLGVGKTTLI